MPTCLKKFIWVKKGDRCIKGGDHAFKHYGIRNSGIHNMKTEGGFSEARYIKY